MKTSWLFIAAALIGARLLLGALGGAEATQFLAGSSTTPGQMLLGVGYVLTHLAAITLAPVLMLATVLERLLGSRA